MSRPDIRQVRNSILLAYLLSVEKVPSIVSAVDAYWVPRSPMDSVSKPEQQQPKKLARPGTERRDAEAVVNGES